MSATLDPTPATPRWRALWAQRRVPPQAQTWLLYGIVGTLFVVLWGLIFWFAADQQRRLLSDGERELVQLRHAVASHTDGLLRSVESDLRVIDRWLQAHPLIDPTRDAAFNALVDDMRRASGGLIEPHWVSSPDELKELPPRDDARRIHIGAPVRSRVTGRWSIPISLRLERPVGGVQAVAAAIELDRLMAFHEQFRALPSGSVILLRDDGVVLSRTPFLDNFIGSNISGSTAYRATQGLSSGSVTTDSTLTDRVKRLVSFERLADYPVLVVVSRGLDDLLARNHARRKLIAEVVGVITLLGLFFTWRLGVSQRALHTAKTAHQRLATELSAAQVRLREITDNAPALIADHDTQLRYRFASRAYQDWLGLAPERVVGRRVPEVLGEAVFAEVRPFMEAALRGETATYEREIKAPNLPRRWVHVTLVPRRDEHGAVSGFYALASDITQRRAAEESLRQSEQRLRSITDRLPMRVSYVDAQQRYRFVNAAYERTHGRPLATLYGLTVREVLGDTAYAAAQPHIERALRGETLSFDSEMSTREGYRCYRVTYIPQWADDASTVLGFVSMVEDTTVQKLEERRLIRLSQIDSLTGLLNRSGFEQRLAEAVARSDASHTTMALLYLDIDHFKAINDRLGHGVGDMLLRGFAGRLARSLRTDDVIGRIGGDEFVVVVQELADSDVAATIARNILAAMRPPFILESSSTQITTSIGVALYRGGAGVTPKALLRAADEFLYLAKGAGRDTFHIDVAGA